jgi:DNA repair exonuclease SbcCD ATPase subunit
VSSIKDLVAKINGLEADVNEKGERLRLAATRKEQAESLIRRNDLALSNACEKLRKSLSEGKEPEERLEIAAEIEAAEKCKGELALDLQRARAEYGTAESLVTKAREAYTEATALLEKRLAGGGK